MNNVEVCAYTHKAVLTCTGLRALSHTPQDHVDLLESMGSVSEVQYAPKGYSYFLRDHLRAVRAGNAFIVGDAVGLATRDLGEGIGPAVASGRLRKTYRMIASRDVPWSENTVDLAVAHDRRHKRRMIVVNSPAIS